MSKKKITKVLDFSKPQTAGQMKQFIDLVDYFHDYVENHSMIMKPLHDMIKNYQKKTRAKAVEWSAEGAIAFLQIVAEIEKGHTMFFPRDDCPIFLMTDACDKGIFILSWYTTLLNISILFTAERCRGEGKQRD